MVIYLYLLSDTERKKEKIMKKLFAVILCAACVFSFAACGGNGGSTVKVSKIILDGKMATIDVGDTYEIAVKTFKVGDEDKNKNLLTYSSADSSVASVDGNVVTGVAYGVTKILVNYEKTTAEFLVEVKASSDINIALSEKSAYLAPTEQYDVNVSVFTINGLSKDVALLSWTSSDTSVATVENGKITAVGAGTASIVAKYKGESETFTAKVVDKQFAAQTDIAELNENAVTVQGRAYKGTDNEWVFDNVNSGIEYSFYGTETAIVVSAPTNLSGNQISYAGVMVDGVMTRIALNKGNNGKYVLADGLNEGVHTIDFYKATEQGLYSAGNCSVKIHSVVSSSKSRIIAVDDTVARLKIDFYGDSITCGAGNVYDGSESAFLRTLCEDGTMSYAAITARALNAKYSMVSTSGIAVDYDPNGLGYKMTELWNKYSRISNQPFTVDKNTDVVVINLGTNDANGNPTAEQMKDYALNLLNPMLAAYGENTKFVWVYGMMGENANVRSGIEAAVALLNLERVTFLSLGAYENHDGELAHPSLEAHKTVADVLTAYIENLVK